MQLIVGVILILGADFNSVAKSRKSERNGSFHLYNVNYSNELTNHQPGGWYFYAQKEGDDMACRKGKGGRKDKGK